MIQVVCDPSGSAASRASRRVLSVIDSTDPRTGGPVQSERCRTESLLPHGVAVEVVSADPPDAPWRDELPFRLSGAGPRRSGYGYAPRFEETLARRLPESDAVVVHGLWQHHGVAAWRVCRRARRRYVVFAHGMLDPWFRRRYPAKHVKKQLFWWLAQYRVLRDAHAVLFTTPTERNRARGGFFPYRFAERVVGFGTRDPGPGHPGEAEAFRAAVPDLHGRPYLLYLGRLHEKKRPLELIQAYGSLPQCPWDLVVAGDGDPDYVERLRQEVARRRSGERVHLPGLLRGDAKWGALRGAEAFVLPSHQENFGIAVAEALACGTPVLISDRVDLAPEIAADGAGLVEPVDPWGDRRLLLGWLEASPERRASLRAAARPCFEMRYDIARHDAEYLALLDELRP